MRIRVLLVLCVLLAGTAIAATDWSAEGKSWWGHIQHLADDKLEGRNTGSEGHRKAAAYVAEKFQEYGLKPVGTAGYFQPVKFAVRQIDEENSRIKLVREGKAEAVELGEDATIGLRSDPAEMLEAAAVFVGYGLSGYVIYVWRKAKGQPTSMISTSTDEPEERGLHQ